jgi:cytochrome c biogenesis protein CcdA
MFTEIATYALSFIAGILTSLSPCVLPLLPILAGTALNTHRYGPYVLAAGLALSFTLFGVLLVSLGSIFGLSAQLWRSLAAIGLIGFGSILLSARLQGWFSRATAGLSQAGLPWLAKITGDTLAAQFALGFVLGIVWSPCVGPTLGAAFSLASQGSDLLHTAIVMLFFGLGASLPLISLGSLTQQPFFQNKAKLVIGAASARSILGGLLIGVGSLILTGLDKSIEIWILDHSPDWLLKLSIAI